MERACGVDLRNVDIVSKKIIKKCAVLKMPVLLFQHSEATETRCEPKGRVCEMQRLLYLSLLFLCLLRQAVFQERTKNK
jgi:hypothetical protein